MLPLRLMTLPRCVGSYPTHASTPLLSASRTFPTLTVARLLAPTGASRAFSASSLSFVKETGASAPEEGTTAVVEAADVGVDPADTAASVAESVTEASQIPALEFGQSAADSFISTQLLTSSTYVEKFGVLGQLLVESLHYYTGLPWWGTTIALVILIRSAMIPLSILQTRTQIAYGKLTPKATLARTRASRRYPNDFFAGIRAQHEAYAPVGGMFGPMKWSMVSFIPIIWLGISVRKMCLTPEWHDTLSEGGLLWFTDLTMSDPFFILPVLNGVLTYAMMKFTQKSSGEGSALQSLLGVVFSVVFLAISVKFPVMLNIFWLTTTTFLAVFNFSMTLPAVRSKLSLPPLNSSKFKIPTGQVLSKEKHAAVPIAADTSPKKTNSAPLKLNAKSQKRR